MADGLGYTPGTGSTVATDQLGDGTHAQFVKIMSGDLDSTNKWKINADGSAVFVQSAASTPTLSNVSAAISSQTILAANANRLGATIYNDSSAGLYLKFGSAASSSSFVVLLGASGYYELPYRYTGIVTGIWTAATGAARVTELTA